MKYLKNPGMHISPFHGTGGQPRYLCEIPRNDGSMRRDLVNAELAHLFLLWDGSREIEAVFEEHKLIYRESKYTLAGLKKFVDNYCVPNSILIDPSSGSFADRISAPKTSASRYMYARYKLASHAFVYAIVRHLRWLYSRPAVILFLSASVLMHVWLYSRPLRMSSFNIGALSCSQLLLMTALLIVAAFCHELGHATALARHGCKHLQIGVGLYLYLPVLYTDVSEAWRLKPWERVQVDFGGIYFHCLSQIVLLASFYVWDKAVFLYAIFMIDITITSSLNPFLRMDGYWLLSDLCGIGNLRRQSFALGSYCWRRVTGQRPLPDLSELAPRSMKILVVYSIIFACFFVYLVCTLGSQLVIHIIPGYPGLWLRLGHDLRHFTSLDAQFLTRLFELVWKTILIIGCSLFVRNSLRRLLASRRQPDESRLGAGITAVNN